MSSKSEGPIPKDCKCSLCSLGISETHLWVEKQEQRLRSAHRWIKLLAAAVAVVVALDGLLAVV